MNEIARVDTSTGEIVQAPPGGELSPLVQWALDARQANQIAQSLARTSFVPATMKGKPDEITACILTGQELGLPPMAALRSMDVIQGVPALRAVTLRGLVQAAGHEVWVVESTTERAIVKGRRAGSDKVETSEWTMARAQGLGLTGKSNWKAQPIAMLIARATSECCRLIAADLLIAAPYAAEELEDGDTTTPPPAVTRRRKAAALPKPPAPEPDLAPAQDAAQDAPATAAWQATEPALDDALPVEDPPADDTVDADQLPMDA